MTEQIASSANTQPNNDGSQRSSPAGSGTAEFRFGTGPEVPEYARGRSPGEVLAITEALRQAYVAQGQPSRETSAPTVTLPTDDDALARPVDAMTRIADARFAQQMAPALQGIQNLTANFASTARMLAEQRYPDVFQKWRGEVEQVLNQIAPEQRTFDNIEKVVKFVRGNHVEEIAAERAQQLIAQGGLGERSGGGGGAGLTAVTAGVDFAKLPAGLGAVAQRVGLTEGMVVDFCKKSGITPEKWMEMAIKEDVVTSVAPFSFELKDEKVGAVRAFDA